MSKVFSQNVIALVWDFDKTLIPGYMQEPLFAAYKVDRHAFWKEVNRLPEAYAEVDPSSRTLSEVLYLNHILDYVKRDIFRGLNNEKLRKFGAELKFYPGLPEFFPELKDFIREKYKEHEIKLEHYVLSTGLRQMILGSRLAPYVDGVWGCELLEESRSDGEKQFTKIGYVLDHTTKTRAVFEINKGVNVEPCVIDVNAQMQQEKRRVPIPQMIYIADGPSDVPVFSVLNRYDGLNYAVYDPASDRAHEQAYKLQVDEKRVQGMGPADYTENSQTWRWLFRAAQSIADRIVVRQKEELDASVGTAPQHFQET